MSKSKAEPYRGPLSASQIADGLLAAKRNAARLLEDATTLYEGGRFPTAVSLAALTIEELGKLAILRRMALAESIDDWRLCWRDFGSHTSKNSHWIVPFLVRDAITPESFFDKFVVDRDPVLLDSLKQFGFYLGCYGRVHWAEPHKVIEKEQVEPIMLGARMLAAGSEPSSLDSPGAVRLWSQELQGCFKCPVLVANNKIVTFLKAFGEEAPSSQGKSIPPHVAFEFMSTALYISGDEQMPTR